MFVKAAPGLKCPKERKPREYIGDADPQTVPDTAFYRRLVADGSLVIVSPAESPPAASKPRLLVKQPEDNGAA